MKLLAHAAMRARLRRLFPDEEAILRAVEPETETGRQPADRDGIPRPEHGATRASTLHHVELTRRAVRRRYTPPRVPEERYERTRDRHVQGRGESTVPGVPYGSPVRTGFGMKHAQRPPVSIHRSGPPDGGATDPTSGSKRESSRAAVRCAMPWRYS